jgi:hypothetical protein
MLGGSTVLSRCSTAGGSSLHTSISIGHASISSSIVAHAAASKSCAKMPRHTKNGVLRSVGSPRDSSTSGGASPAPKSVSCSACRYDVITRRLPVPMAPSTSTRRAVPDATKSAVSSSSASSVLACASALILSSSSVSTGWRLVKLLRRRETTHHVGRVDGRRVKLLSPLHVASSTVTVCALAANAICSLSVIAAPHSRCTWRRVLPTEPPTTRPVATPAHTSRYASPRRNVWSSSSDIVVASGGRFSTSTGGKPKTTEAHVSLPRV